ncbi:MAG: transposase [Desulfovermiculus sp.]|nr:transposase [Desulfovermiculus sp.]
MIPPEKRLLFRENMRTISYILIRRFWAEIAYYLVYIDMVLTDDARDYFLSIQFRVRQAAVTSLTSVPFTYEDEPFFTAYKAVTDVWKNRKPQRAVAESLTISRSTLKDWDHSFALYGTVALLPEVSHVQVDPALERLVILIKLSRPHERANYALRLAEALDIEGASLERVRQIQRSYGYGQRMDEADIDFWSGLQHILESVTKQKEKPPAKPVHNLHDRAGTFFNYQRDHLQHRVELFKALSQLEKKRQIRPVLQEFGMAPNRFYVLKNRYMLYGVWGLADLVQKGQSGEKISPQLELQIIEERLMDPSLSTAKMIKKLNLKCSRANVQKIYTRWKLSRFKKPVAIRGVISSPVPTQVTEKQSPVEASAKSKFSDLIDSSGLKVNRSFLQFIKRLAYRKVVISNPGTLLLAPFLDQLGVIEAWHTYGPNSLRTSQITNNIIVNVMRIIAGFPSIHDFTLNADRSVAVASGLVLNPGKTRFYDAFDDLRFSHLQHLRNDASCRARELGIIEGKEIAIDYHCDPSDSRFPEDKALSKAPDKNGDMTYAHRPQILWDSMTNTIINIAYCEGKSRAPSALYRFCERNLFKIIDPDVITEIYADSEYTGEKQLIYLTVRSESDITMCLKQNPKIKRWKEETIQKGVWQDYREQYRIASQDFILPETGKSFRFVVKQNKETNEIRCFGSTHTDYSPIKILDAYHIRWPVETGIKDLIENYFLNKPTGTSPEKVEAHYYCIMLARLAVDYFRSQLCTPQWRSPEDWECVLSTIRTSIFSNQNCELSLDDSGDLLITYLDGDRQGIKKRLAELLTRRKEAGLNRVSWWGNRGVQIQVKDQYAF